MIHRSIYILKPGYFRVGIEPKYRPDQRRDNLDKNTFLLEGSDV